MKKVCVFLMFILVVYGIFPAYATTDIAADAESSECTENVTGTYSGDANFKAKWTPNSIQLNWYNNNTLMQGVNTESNTCNYDGTLTIPTIPPERIGYIFDGWKVRPKFDFATLAPGGSNALTTVSERWGRGYYSIYNRNYCWQKLGNGATNEMSCTDSAFSDLELHEWKIEFRSGTTTGMLYGGAYCSAKIGNWGDDTQWNIAESFSTYNELESATGEKRYCWCQVTGWKPYSNNPYGIVYGPSSASVSSVWVFRHNNYSVDNCLKVCTQYCIDAVVGYPAFRRALFVGDGN